MKELNLNEMELVNGGFRWKDAFRGGFLGAMKGAIIGGAIAGGVAGAVGEGAACGVLMDKK